MAEGMFKTMFGTGVLDDDFFKTINDLTKDIQSTIHTIQEKYENGKLVSKDEEKYENGEKTLDVHETSASTLDCKESDCEDECCGKCNSEVCTCGKEDTCTVDEKDEIIAGLEVDLDNCYAELKKIHKECNQWKDAYYKVLDAKEQLELKLENIKKLF